MRVINEYAPEAAVEPAAEARDQAAEAGQVDLAVEAEIGTEEGGQANVQKKPAGAAVDVTTDWDVAAPKGGIASYESDQIVCGKCGAEMPSGDGVVLNVNGTMAKGWTLSGRGNVTVKCGACNTTCVQLHRQAIQLSSMEMYNPVEIRKFFEEAKALSGKAVKQAIHFHSLCVSHFHFLCVLHFQCLCVFCFQCLCVFRFQRLFVFDFQD